MPLLNRGRKGVRKKDFSGQEVVGSNQSLLIERLFNWDFTPILQSGL